MPAAFHVQDGNTIDHTPGSAVAAGAVVVITGGTAGKQVGIADRDIPANTRGALTLVGVYEVDKLSTDVVTIGDKLYWDAGNSRATLTASTHALIGIAVSAAGNGVTRVKVRLQGTVT